MRTQLTLVMVVEHDDDYDPSSHFVHYFSDDAPEPVVLETHENWDELYELTPEQAAALRILTDGGVGAPVLQRHRL